MGIPITEFSTPHSKIHGSHVPTSGVLLLRGSVFVFAIKDLVYKLEP